MAFRNDAYMHRVNDRPSSNEYMHYLMHEFRELGSPNRELRELKLLAFARRHGEEGKSSGSSGEGGGAEHRALRGPTWRHPVSKNVPFRFPLKWATDQHACPANVSSEVQLVISRRMRLPRGISRMQFIYFSGCFAAIIIGE